MTAKPSDRESSLILASRVARLGTVDASGKPLVIPVCFAYLSGRIYVPIDKKPKDVVWRDLKRIRNISANPGVTLLIDGYYEDWNKLYYIIIHGQAEVLTEGEAYKNSLKALCLKYAQYQEMRLEEAGLPVIRIEPERIHSWGSL